MRRRLHDLELGNRRLAELADLPQSLGRRRDDLDERAECLQQLLRQRLDVTLRDRAKENQLEHLVVGERRRAALAEARAQALAVAEIMRRGLGEAGCVRSEERRVGKEGKSRWAPSREKIIAILDST